MTARQFARRMTQVAMNEVAQARHNTGMSHG
jgi:hypothetical protein